MQTVFEETGPRSALALPPRTILNNAYEIGKVLGKGGFGITYAAVDQNLKVPVAIKEFLPAQVAGRGTDRSTVQPHSGGDDNVFEHGLEAFLAEAQTLAQFEHPNIVGVKSFFRANGTGYLVMPFYEGQTLDAYLRGLDGPMPKDDAMAMLDPVLEGLEAVHAQGILHRDIKPQNVYLTDSGGTVLLDFGAARIAFGEESQSLSAVLTPGYAPFEQYSRRGRQGPWTDVYATAAMLYRMVTGEKPPDATDRIGGEPLPPPEVANPGLPADFSAALTSALAVQPDGRPQTVAAFRQSLAGGDETEVVTQLGGAYGDETVVQYDPETKTLDVFPGQTAVSGGSARTGTPSVGSGAAAGATLALEAKRNVRYRVDGGEVASLARGERRVLAVAPGEHRVEMSFQGVRRSAKLTVAAGETKAVVLDLPGGKRTGGKAGRPPRKRQQKTEFDQGSGSGVLKWVLGLGAALVVVSLVIAAIIGSQVEIPEPEPERQDERVSVAELNIQGENDALAQAIRAAEEALRSQVAAQGGTQPTSGIEALRFAGLGEPVVVQGTLGSGDGMLDGGEFADLYMFGVSRADYLFVEMTSTTIDPYLLLLGPDGEVVIEVDDVSATDLNAILDTPLPGPGIYSLFATSAGANDTGSYTLTVIPDFVP